jgi:hypothetical protein
MTAYLGVTVHYIDKDWGLHAELLAFDELGGSHTGENTGRVLYEILNQTGIKDKVCTYYYLSFNPAIQFLSLPV